MSANRCAKCGLLHLPDDRERCANARKLATVLLTAGAQLASCTNAYHERLKADAATFLLQTDNHRDWRDDHDRLLIGECVRCSSTLAFYVGSVVALSAMRGSVQR